MNRELKQLTVARVPNASNDEAVGVCSDCEAYNRLSATTCCVCGSFSVSNILLSCDGTWEEWCAAELRRLASHHVEAEGRVADDGKMSIWVKV